MQNVRTNQIKYIYTTLLSTTNNGLIMLIVILGLDCKHELPYSSLPPQYTCHTFPSCPSPSLQSSGLGLAEKAALAATSTQTSGG